MDLTLVHRFARFPQYPFIQLGPVVRNLINANPALKVYEGYPLTRKKN